MTGPAVVPALTVYGTDVSEESPLLGASLREAELRQRTGVSVLAIQRGEETVANPEPDFELETPARSSSEGASLSRD
jgi:K+/H+ antiporter YhaU regulatory subunit KhtT